jgi:hypothetical protein
LAIICIAGLAHHIDICYFSDIIAGSFCCHSLTMIFPNVLYLVFLDLYTFNIILPGTMILTKARPKFARWWSAHLDTCSPRNRILGNVQAIHSILPFILLIDLRSYAALFTAIVLLRLTAPGQEMQEDVKQLNLRVFAHSSYTLLPILNRNPQHLKVQNKGKFL